MAADEPEIMTTPEVAEHLRIPEATLHYWVHRGVAPPSVRLGKRRLYRREAVDAWLIERERAEAAVPA
ncbi:helix-turn-helix transcriptional regulator [Aquipuribacter sp. SD81]|uniref:helix-turn-helix transcriptional regulator n=1 Tax=Aquipuribacter sp. SD81 TaxID=3127703 RepID=UPI00301AF4B5